MIKKLTLHNFQSHKHTELEFNPYVNVITGSSDSGKSAILRAIYWVVHNRPNGNNFLVSHWARNANGTPKEDMYVSFEYDTGTKITRFKNKNENTYSIDGVTLEAIGIDVPEKVRLANNFTEVNISKQMDAPFLLSESAGEVARFFNRVVHFDVIDEYLITIESMRKKNNQDIKYTQEALKDVESQINKYEWIDAAEHILNQIDDLKVDEITTLHTNLQRGVVEYARATENLVEIQCVLHRAYSLVDLIEEKTNTLKSMIYKQTQLESSLVTYAENKNVVNCIDTVYAQKLVNRIQKIQDQILSVQPAYNSLSTSIKTYKETDSQKQEIAIGLINTRNKLPSICPVCGGKL